MSRRIEQYELHEELGHGGMASVYRARDLVLERDVAVKVLHQHIASNDEYRQRFHREARAAARLVHPNIVRVYGFSGQDSEDGYLAMELVGGPTALEFRHLLPEPLLPEPGAMLVALIARALHHAHEQEILHRDIKPENIMIDCSGSPRLMDFGLARMLDGQAMTATGAVIGSPAHMAPEIIEGDDYDQRVDIFSLGTVLYFLTCGELPFGGHNPAMTLRAVLAGDYAPPGLKNAHVGEELGGIISDCLSTRPQDRPRTALEVAERLEQWLGNVGIHDVDTEFHRCALEPHAWCQSHRKKLPGMLVSSAHAHLALQPPETARALSELDRALLLDPNNRDAALVISNIGSNGGPATRRRLAKLIWPMLAVLGLVIGYTLIQARFDKDATLRNTDQTINVAHNLVHEALVPAAHVAQIATVQSTARGRIFAAIATARRKSDSGYREALTDTISLTSRSAHAAVNTAAQDAAELAERLARRNATVSPRLEIVRPSAPTPEGGEPQGDQQTPRSPDPIDPDAASFRTRFIVSPPVAELYIDGRQACSGRANCLIEITEGSHEVRAVHPETGVEVTRRVTVSRPGATHRLRVPWPDATLVIDSNLPGTVLLDGERIGRTNTPLSIPINSVRRESRAVIRVIPDGEFQRPAERSLTLLSGQLHRELVTFGTSD